MAFQGNLGRNGFHTVTSAVGMCWLKELAKANRMGRKKEKPHMLIISGFLSGECLMAHIEYHEGPNRRLDLIQAGSASVEITTKGAWINTDAGSLFIPADDVMRVASALSMPGGGGSPAIQIAPKVA